MNESLILQLFQIINEDSSTHDMETALAVKLNSPWIDAVLFLEYPRGKRFLCIVCKNRHRRLNDDRPLIAFLVDEVNRAAGETHPVFQRLSLNVQAGKGRQQGRVDIHDAVGERPHEDGRERTHEASENDQLDIVRF